MYKAAKERTGHDTSYAESVLTTLQSRLDALKTKESRLLDTFLDEQIAKEVYDVKALEIHNERVSLTRQIGETKRMGMQGESTLEPVKEIFLRGSRAKKEFLAADDLKKHEIMKNLLWNLSLKNKSVAQIKYKSPYQVLAKAPKKDDILSLLGDLDSTSPLASLPATLGLVTGSRPASCSTPDFASLRALRRSRPMSPHHMLFSHGKKPYSKIIAASLRRC
jgi:hypothetical protein